MRKPDLLPSKKIHWWFWAFIDIMVISVTSVFIGEAIYQNAWNVAGLILAILMAMWKCMPVPKRC